MIKYVMDSYAMIAFFEDESGADRVSEVLNEIAERKAKGFMSVMHWGEIFYNTMREQGIEVAETIRTQFNKYQIQLIDVDKKLTYQAAKLKAKYTVAYVDCFAAALSLRMKALLVTGDSEFRKLEHEIKIEWITDE